MLATFLGSGAAASPAEAVPTLRAALTSVCVLVDDGLPAGRPGSEAEALHNLLGLAAFPDVFDWRRYPAQIGASAQGWPRLRCLEHGVAVGAVRGDPLPLADGKAGPFLAAVSDAVWGSGRHKAAFEVLRRAVEREPESAVLHHRMAHRCRETGRERDAEHRERRAFDLGLRSMWTCARLAGYATERRDVEESYRLLASYRGRYEGLAPWRRALRDAVEAALEVEFPPSPSSRVERSDSPEPGGRSGGGMHPTVAHPSCRSRIRGPGSRPARPGMTDR